jgi:3-isopropylmalate/(R)-2-methylmalate dehydratase small subunit
VIADSFARIFYRNSINIGLPIVESRDAVREIGQGDVIEVDLEKGEILNVTKGKTYRAKPFPPFMQDLIAKGGLMNKVKSELKK